MIAFAALALATVLVAFIVFGGSTHYKLTAVLQDASQLVKGNLVEVGGVTIGTVKDIRLNDQGQAELTLDITDGSFAPLHRGTSAQIRVASLSSIASRYVALQAGPANAAAIPAGATIPIENTQPVVDLDSVMNTLDAQSRQALQDIIHGSATTFAGQTLAANAGLRQLNPALAQTAATVNELDADQAAFERFIVESAAVVGTVASRNPALDRGLTSAATLTRAIASQTGALSQTLQEAPGALRQADTTLADLRGALTEVQPTAALLRPVAPRLNTFVRQADPVISRALPALRDLRAFLPELGGALQTLPSLNDAAQPAFTAATGAIAGFQPILNGGLAALPDITHGILEGFAGNTGGYYDANGEYARIQPEVNSLSATGLGPLLNGLVGGSLKTGQTNRCPGAAQEPAPDHSNPFVTSALPCDPTQHP